MARLKSIFDRRAGKDAVVSAAPSPRTSPLSQTEKINRQRLKNAAAFAKAILKHANGRAFYEELASQKKISSAYRAAVSDYFERLSQ